MMESIIQWINFAMTAGVMIYVVRVEHRLTALETTLHHLEEIIKNGNVSFKRRKTDG